VIETANATMQNLTAYALDLEMEVDRLRRRDQFWQQTLLRWIKGIEGQLQTADAQVRAQAPCTTIAAACHEFRQLWADLSEPPGYHPAFDQVVAIAIRALAEQIFREQQRLNDAPQSMLRFELESEHVLWFPARLRHILDSLLSNALRFRDADKGEVRVGLALRTHPDGYELIVSDNGLGMTPERLEGQFDLTYRAAPARAAGLGVGLAVVKALVEQCCGTLSVSSGEGAGTSISVCLPRFDVNDHVQG
jgi:light-regulated signal transduction histidine kinase (bacteriophytochrome)